VFEQYRRALADENLPSALRVDFEYYLGAGYRLFGHDARAETWLSRAVATASSIQANEMLIKAEQLLSEMRSGRHTTVKSTDTPVANPSRHVTEVAEAIHEMRSLAGVSG